MEQQYDDTFLARWLSNELSENELQEFKASEYYNQYCKIIDTIDAAEFPEYNTAQNFTETIKKVEKLKKKTTSRKISLWIYAAAACLLLFASYFFFFQEVNHQTNYAEKTSILLPDNSTVNLNAGSKISYSKLNWQNKREIKLSGEAFFSVEKGKTFLVKTKESNVVVLGTKFTVKSRKNFYNVICYEGKVSVEIKNKQAIILEKGDALTLQNNKIEIYSIDSNNIDSLLNESSFNNTSIIEVIAELERQFNIEINGKEHLKKASFTGRFLHKDLNLALKTVFVAMEIPYQLDTKGNVIIQKY